MDINSLLSPQDSPASETPPSPLSHPGLRRNKSSSLTPNNITSSPAGKPSPILPHNAVAQAQQILPSPPIISPGHALSTSATSTPTGLPGPLIRQGSTPGMDTLADLASMQHHQQTARANANGLRSAEVYDNQHPPAGGIMPALHTLSRTNSISHSTGLNNSDQYAASANARRHTVTTLSQSDLEAVEELLVYLAANPYAHGSHIRLVNLLHQGFISYLGASDDPDDGPLPHRYDLLDELRRAREDMEARFPVGEDLWVDWIEDEILIAQTVEERIAVLELCQRAVEEEVGSTRLWSLYGNWMWKSYSSCHNISDDSQTAVRTRYAWTAADKMVGQEVLSWQAMVDVWKSGTEATKWRINDSHLVWDRYSDLLLRDLASHPVASKISLIKGEFIARLQIPHGTWDQTFQAFSSFMSNYDNTNYEATMVEMTRLASDAKAQYALRETFEGNILRAEQVKDPESEWNGFSEYLEWELGRPKRRGGFSADLCNSLFERAVIRFPTETSLWEDYTAVVIDESLHGGLEPSRVLPILQRATRHCPWSGTLWSQYLLTCEREEKSFQELEDVKHRATSTGVLDMGSMEEVLKVYTAWCGFLRRRAFRSDATDEELDVAEVGILTALESVTDLGKKKYGKEYKGDPLYRIERIHIKLLAQSGSWDAAREQWRRLIPLRGTSYDFWLRYYYWEIYVWGKLQEHNNYTAETTDRSTPKEAFAVLMQAAKRTDLDWPETILETLLRHCENHEDVEDLQLAQVQVRKAQKALAKRREKQASEAAAAAVAAAAAAAGGNEQQEYPLTATSTSPASKHKRKREDDTNPSEESINKRSKPADSETNALEDQEMSEVPDQSASAEALLKRDRENLTIVVRNLPVDTSELRVRQYFRDCGSILSLKVVPEEDHASAIATIEFESKEDVLAAQTKDMKSFEGNTIEVQVGSGSSLFVSNFPPIADEEYIRDLFHGFGDIVDVRFPSLKYNTHRRFCYVQFKSGAQAQAATSLDGELLAGKFKLTAKISNPLRKQDRSGALYEGRELYISNLDWSATEDELSDIFKKYGKVERVRLPKNVGGKSKGIAFVVFSTKDEANAALELNLTKFKKRMLNVALSTPNPAKRQATTVITPGGRSSTSPGPEHGSENGDHHSERRSSVSSEHKPTSNEIRERTIALMNIPDTVNDARIRALAESYGPLTKVVLRPDHQGAIIEFGEVHDAGKAALAIEGQEIAPGRKVRVGPVSELLKQSAETKTAAGFKPSKDAKSGETLKPSVVRRPVLGGTRGGRGNLGVKIGGFGLGASREKKAENTNGADEDVPKGKSNADFKAMFTKQ